MSQSQRLERSLRRSETVTDEQLFNDYMSYAGSVQDEEAVLLYMEQNQIGLNQVDYWLARLSTLRHQARFKEMTALLKQVKQMPGVGQNVQVHHFEKAVTAQLEKELNSFRRGRRKAREFGQVMQEIHPVRRNFNGVIVFVDAENRGNFKLEDFSKFVEEELTDYCSILREDYFRQMRLRQEVSFIAKSEAKFLQLTKQLVHKTQRNSLGSKYSPRFSDATNLRQSDAQENPLTTPKRPCKKRHNSSRDSVQILMSMQRQKQENRVNNSQIPSKSPILSNGSEPEVIRREWSPQASPHFNFMEEDETEEKEICRSVPANNNNSCLIFSFGKKKNQRQESSPSRSSKNDAFLFDSFCKDPNLNATSQGVEKEDFELGLLIQQTQREAYEAIETKTFSFSDVDSNQENNAYPVMVRDNKVKQPFAQIEEAPYKSVDLEQLMSGMDEQNPEVVRHSVFPGSEDSWFRSEKKLRSGEQEQSTPYFSDNKFNSRNSGSHR